MMNTLNYILRMIAFVFIIAFIFIFGITSAFELTSYILK